MPTDAAAARARCWGGVYTARGEHAVSWFAPHPAVSLQLLDAAQVAPDQTVIDVGAGASRLVDALLARGHTDITALDLVDAGLAIARTRLARNGQPTCAAAARIDWLVTDLLEWRPGRRYYVWHDRAVFHFLTDPDDRARYLQVLDRAIEAAGVIVIGTFAEDGPQACSGLPTARYAPEHLHEALGGSDGWVELARYREHHTTPWGADQAFTWLALARRER